MAVVCLALSFAMAYFSLLVVERPFRIRPFPVRAVLLAGVAVSALFIGVGALDRLAKGFPSRFPSMQTGPIRSGSGRSPGLTH